MYTKMQFLPIMFSRKKSIFNILMEDFVQSRIKRITI